MSDNPRTEILEAAPWKIIKGYKVYIDELFSRGIVNAAANQMTRQIVINKACYELPEAEMYAIIYHEIGHMKFSDKNPGISLLARFLYDREEYIAEEIWCDKWAMENLDNPQSVVDALYTTWQSNTKMPGYTNDMDWSLVERIEAAEAWIISQERAF